MDLLASLDELAALGAAIAHEAMGGFTCSRPTATLDERGRGAGIQFEPWQTRRMSWSASAQIQLPTWPHRAPCADDGLTRGDTFSEALDAEEAAMRVG